MRLALVSSLLFILTNLALVAAERVTLTDQLNRTLIGQALELNGQKLRFRRASDGRTFDINLSDLRAESSSQIKALFAKSQPTANAVTRELEPGSTITLNFPELGNMANKQATKCELYIPTSYSNDEKFPLLVWFHGGAGSHKIGTTKGLVDYEKFIIVALPYPNGLFPRLGVENGTINDFWDFQKPMLEAIQQKVPNISEDIRIAGGFSSGGHLVGSALDLKWKGFTDYFTAFILHEGGTSPNMTFKGLRSKHRVLVTYGEKSKSLEWQLYFNEKMKAAHRRTDIIGIPNCGHSLNADVRSAINNWIKTELLDD